MPIPLVVAGIGLAVAGTAVSMYGASQAAEASQNIARTEQQENKVRQQAMEQDARRRELEIIRQQQRARSQALVNANATGAMYGSGLQGGYGQISGQTGTNINAVISSLLTGRQLFQLDNQISNYKMDLANAQFTSSIGQSLTSLGGSLMRIVPTVSNLTGGMPSTLSGPLPGLGSPTSIGYGTGYT